MFEEINLIELKQILSNVGELIGNSKILDCIPKLSNDIQYIAVNDSDRTPKIFLPEELYESNTTDYIILEICKKYDKYKIRLLTANEVDWLC